MKTLKQASVRILIVATLFTSTAALSEEAKPKSEVVQPKTEVVVPTKPVTDVLMQELRQQLSLNIKHQVNTALSHSVELIKDSLR